MPWTPTPTAPVSGSRLGWSPTGPPRPTPTPRQGWFVVQQHAGSDTGTGFDTGALLVHLAGADNGAGQDQGALLAHLAGADQATGTDRGALLAHLTGSDAGAGADSGMWMLHYDAAGSDLGTGTDTGALLTHLLGADSASGQDQGTILTHLTGSDAGTGTDSGRPAYMNGYTGSKAATTVPDATWTDLLTFTASGNGTASTTFTVAHSWQRDLFNVVSNTRGVRVLVNGTQVAIQTQTYTNQTWSSTLTQSGVSVPSGVAVQIQGYCENGAYTASRTVTISSASMTVQGVA